MSSIREPSDFTVIELKEKLKDLGLNSTECKSELIARLIETNVTGAWTQDAFKVAAIDLTDTAVQLLLTIEERSRYTSEKRNLRIVS